MLSATTYNETYLVQRLQNGDRQAMSELYDRFSGALLGVIMKIIPEQSAAEDILQESMLKIWSNINSFDAAKGRLFTWMINIARNQSIDKTRSKSFKKQQQNQSIEDSVHLQESIPSSAANMDALGVRNWLTYLPQDSRQLMEMVYFMGFTQNEISKELNMPLGTVKTKIRNSLIVLRKQLNIS